MTGHRMRLGLPAYPGWLVREQVEAVPPDGSVHVHAFSEPVQDATTGDFAAGYGQLLREVLPGYEEIDLREVQLFGGRPALLRRYRHVPTDGAPLTQLTAYLVEGGIGHVVTVTTATSRFAASEGELISLLTRIELDRSAALERPATSPAIRGPRGEPSWDAARSAWQSASKARTAKDVSPDVIADLSADELTALAQLVGGERFPFVDESEAADALGEAGPAVLRASRRSLSARGLVTPSADGTLALGEELRDAVALALDPDLVVTVEAEGAQDLRFALAADPSHAAEVQRLGGDGYRIGIHPAGHVVARVLQLTGAYSSSAKAAGDRTEVLAIAIDRARAFLRIGDHDAAARELGQQPALLDALATAASFNRVRSMFRRNGVVHGGELVWCQPASGAAWVLESVAKEGEAPTSIEARSVGRAELHAQLLALLP
jgi:hypothetical protein